MALGQRQLRLLDANAARMAACNNLQRIELLLLISSANNTLYLRAVNVNGIRLLDEDAGSQYKHILVALAALGLIQIELMVRQHHVLGLVEANGCLFQVAAGHFDCLCSQRDAEAIKHDLWAIIAFLLLLSFSI